jgi:TonB family protein
MASKTALEVGLAQVGMTCFRVILAVMASAFLSSAGSAQPRPGAQWSLNSKSCILWRTYGNGKASTRLGIKPSMTGDATRIFIIYPGTDTPNRWVKGSFLIDNAPALPIDFIDFPTKEGRFVKIELAPATMATAMKAASWQVQGERLREFEFQLDGLASAIPGLERCVAEQLVRLGLDENSQARVAEPPTTDLLKYFSSDDYPVLAAELGISGRTGVRLVVGSDGKVLDCYVRESSGNAVLDHVTCETFERDVQFTPAKDASGKYLASVTSVTINWEMPIEEKKSKSH